MTERPSSTPIVAWAYGLLGLIPFAACAVGVARGGAHAPLFAEALALYAGLILSFLGGARWGLEIGRPRVRAAIISASMAPTLIAFALLLSPLSDAWVFAGFALAFAAAWAWDARAVDAPAWYPRLRAVLSLGAIAALIVGAFA